MDKDPELVSDFPHYFWAKNQSQYQVWPIFGLIKIQNSPEDFGNSQKKSKI